MALQQTWNDEIVEEQARPRLTVLDGGSASLRVGATIAERRQRREAMMRRRRRTILALIGIITVVLMLIPGHAFGSQTDGANPDLSGHYGLAVGSVYTVQSGDTVTSIAKKIAPDNVAVARKALIAYIGSSYVVPGERIVIP
jgi:predicted anti-sigma-YlaC factor YlaD